jgi:hypothetical protein
MLRGERVAQRRSRPVLLPWDVKMPGWGQVLCTLLLAFVIFVSLYPMLQVLIQSFHFEPTRRGRSVRTQWLACFPQRHLNPEHGLEHDHRGSRTTGYCAGDRAGHRMASGPHRRSRTSCF